MGVDLAMSSGDARIDAILVGTIALYILLFPGRLRALYLEGSSADATRLQSSDLDFTLVFANRFLAGERAQAEQALRACAALSAIEYDATVVDEEMLARGAWPTLKLAGQLVWGEDVRANMGLDLTAWTRDRMHSSYYRLGALFGRGGAVRLPLDYPAPDAEFFGYDARTIHLLDGREVKSTRDLIRAAGWIASALVAYQAGRFVSRKADCATAYSAEVGGEFAPWLDELFTQCRDRWGYHIPEDAGERAMLRTSCVRMLDFERHFLAIYQPYLLVELRGADLDGQLKSLEALTHAPFADTEVLASVEGLAKRQGAAPHTLAHVVATRLRVLIDG